ncbi:plasmid mobilization protein [Belnapia rosea]|uniref:plasmid mobilization protein n=1 Tax=Belnapia rosea TaxID=938405 RepID=UPI000888628D|nr:hypothetical protein [Belnapia rosea]SDB20242.1 hypothetical protein SAMN02927895_00797 [Belnapia rosea]
MNDVAGTAEHGAPTVCTRRRSGSERRARRQVVGVRLTEQERAQLNLLAAAAGLKAPDYLRRLALARAGLPKTGRIPSPGMAAAAALRALACQAVRIGSGVAELSARLEATGAAGRAVPCAPELAAAAAELRALRADLREALRMRSVLEASRCS